MAKLYGFLNWVCLCVVALGMAGCASDDEVYSQLPRETGRSAVTSTDQKPLQCVPFARDHSAVKIFGDAWTWWDQAAGKFPRGPQPQPGAVMVLTGYAGPQRGHVAVVQKIISPREIRVDHANWLDDGSIFLNDPVEDVSADNDWSQVRVYNIKTGGWGGNIYPVQGFIGGSNSDSAPLMENPGDPSPELDARATPRNTRPLSRRAAPARQATPMPKDDVPPDASEDRDPLPNPDMVVSANIPQSR